MHFGREEASQWCFFPSQRVFVQSFFVQQCCKDCQCQGQVPSQDFHTSIMDSNCSALTLFIEKSFNSTEPESQWMVSSLQDLMITMPHICLTKLYNLAQQLKAHSCRPKLIPKSEPTCEANARATCENDMLAAHRGHLQQSGHFRPFHEILINHDKPL